MALKPEYRNTRGDLKKLASDVRPGDRLYVVHDIATNLARYEDKQLYTEYIVTKDRALDFNGTLMVRPAGAGRGPGVQSLGSLLGKEGTVYGKLPAGIRHLNHGAQVATNAELEQRALKAGREEIANNTGARRILAAAGVRWGRS